MFRKLTSALLISVAMHLLLICYVVEMLPDHSLHSSKTTPSPLQITLGRQTISTAVHADQDSSSTRKNKSVPAETLVPQSLSTPPLRQRKLNNKDQASSVEPDENKVTSKRILASSKEISRIMSSSEQPEHTIQTKDSTSTIFSRALNDNREAPGISTLADGTTRVVTDWGNSYCIKALDDWKIIDPQDDMRVSVFCN